ncbi:MAG TPA: TatD family hydrolase, partial [Thermoanaerobaculia bacterium]
MIDSHCHLQSLPEGERERALDAARLRGVRGFLVPCIRLDEAEAILAFCHRHADVWCALGVHPHDASTWGPGDRGRLAALLADPKAVAVGECGLDFYYDHSPRDVQERALREQWELAVELGLPVVVHNRDSNEAMLELVREAGFAALTADFHSFAGGLAMGRELIDRGFYLGLSGMITFPKATNVREVIPLLP